ncbi:alcohol dehydrogenase catalytic domain-containing protein [Flexivirga sp. ID2601S]|uniref:Alcohol dehydrogenase n=1 Tax=Flexivirga aerilata TaxID=1656889 RepID=A0A849ANB9_9MICO|nr:alcohol dehydrogenase [Flexivirga aerilata]NNG38302.1 alcohol dehydrogenase catalytic domain-containing protein [Flexivirga aerilata]
MATMKAVQVPARGAAFELREVPVPEPDARQVRVKVQACGVCHSDALTVAGAMGNSFPRTPGHEVAGVIDAVGDDVTAWQVGQRVGVGWFGGCDFTCDPCRRGDFISCVNGQVCGISYDGGYAEYLVAPQEALASIPDDLSAVDAAPLMCAGVTTFNALRRSVARAGDLVAILGIGGLGHLGVQFAAKMGFETVAIARGTEKEPLARKLGAHHYIDSTATDVAKELQKLGGAKVVLATVTAPPAMAATIGGLHPRGELLVVGASGDPMEVAPFDLIPGSLAVQGHASGTSQDSQDTMAFSTLVGVRPSIETMPLEQAQAAYDRMMSGEARFRVVLTVGDEGSAS